MTTAIGIATGLLSLSEVKSSQSEVKSELSQSEVRVRVKSEVKTPPSSKSKTSSKHRARWATLGFGAEA